jgi:hypothetical protein
MSYRHVILLPQPRITPPRSMPDGYWSPLEVVRRAHRKRGSTVTLTPGTVTESHQSPYVAGPIRDGWCEDCSTPPTDYYWHSDGNDA